MKEISKNLKCLVLRNGIEIWRESERLENLQNILISGKKVGFIEVDNEMINSVDIVGVFTSGTMDEMTRRKNGQWKCEQGNWHERKDRCECLSKKQLEIKKSFSDEFYTEKGFYPA